MGEVVRLFPRKKHLRGHIRDSVTEALNTTPRPIGAIIIILGENDDYAVRSAHVEGKIKSFDLYARSEALIDMEKRGFLEDK